MIGPHHRSVGYDERPRGSSRLAVDEARDDFLPRPRRAGDENAPVGRRGTLRSQANLLDRRRTPDQLSRFAGPQLQLGNLAPQLGGFERAGHGEQQSIGVQRLFDELVGALLDGGDGGVDRSVSADHDDGHFGVTVHHRFQHVHAVEIAALQPDVENDQRRWRAGVDRFDCGRAIGRIARQIAAVFEDSGNRLSDQGLVVDDQDIAGHQLSPFAIVARSVPGAAKTSAIRAPPSVPLSMTRRPP